MKRPLWILIGAGAVALLGAVAAAWLVFRLMATPAFEANERSFGDQHLKTTVALVELHRLRTGRYPERLADLTFVGEWDRIALARTSYCTNSDRTRYFVEVRTGFVAKPKLEMPPEFWKGTGYDPTLGPCP